MMAVLCALLRGNRFPFSFALGALGGRFVTRRLSWLAGALVFVVFSLFAPSGAWAQGGPPLITNDPGTPGPNQWEINLAVMPTLVQGEQNYQVPQIDVNYGVGPRIQLTFEVPYVLQTATGQGLETGWGNAFPGVKWRFIDNKHGWNVSVFPQVEPPGRASSVRGGIADPGTRFLLPLEIQRNVGPMELNFEAGYYVPVHGREERILGFAAGHQVDKKLELIGEVYNDSAMGAPPHNTTWDVGDRYEFHKGLIQLFMAGRSFSGAAGEPTFFTYIGIQILLEGNGRHLHADE
jgi:hypothetical protein